MNIEDQLFLLHKLNHPRSERSSSSDLVSVLRGETERGKVMDARLTSQSEIWRGVEADVRWLSQPDNFLLSIIDDDYPVLLKEIPDPPALLFCRGDRGALGAFKLAMVGSRYPTASGRETAERLAGELSEAGLLITSGMALGIDAASHRGALSRGGLTIAVLGTGVDEVYPKTHRRLAEEIKESGLLMSEYPTGTPAYPWNFPRRNRIVTGLSLGTLVVEAALKSGSLISARLTMEQGREVFAVPGSIRSKQSQGCHQLIRDGAALTESIADILGELESLVDYQMLQPQQEQTPSLSKDSSRLLALLSADPIPFDRLAQLTETPVPGLASLLMELEVEGLVVSEVNGYRLR